MPALRLFYFLYYANVGANLPFFAPYLQGLGFTGAEIGTIQMLSAALGAPVGLAWAALADRLGAPGRTLRLASLGSLVSLAVLPWAQTPLQVGLVVAAQGLFSPAVVPLVDAIAVELLQRSGGSYPRTRLFGSLGYVVVAQGLGLLLAARGDRAGDPAVAWALVACTAGYALVAFRMPEAPPPAERAHLSDAWALLRDRRLLELLLLGALHWSICAPYHLLFGVFVREQGHSASLTGLAMGMGVVTEVVVLWQAGPLERRFGVRTLLGASFAGTALRWALLSTSSGATTIVLLQLFHGLTFGLFWATVVRALAGVVPARFRATGQALFGAVVFSLGSALGNQLTGLAFDRAGQVAPLFRGAALLELLPLALVLGAAAWGTAGQPASAPDPRSQA